MSPDVGLRPSSAHDLGDAALDLSPPSGVALPDLLREPPPGVLDALVGEAAPTAPARLRHDVLGVGVDAVDVDGLHRLIAERVASRRRSLVLNVNAHCLNLAVEQAWLHAYLNEADVVFCDGFGVALAARILRRPALTRVTYADWMWQYAAFAARHGHTLYLLGGRPGIARAAADRLTEAAPGLHIAGTHHGYFDTTRGSRENRAVVSAVNAAAPDVLVVGLGMPLQERWLRDNWGRLDATVALTGGAVFDYVSGSLRRGPAWMTDHGLEWLARLAIEPTRLWRRYLVGNPTFLRHVARQWAGERRRVHAPASPRAARDARLLRPAPPGRP